MTAPTTWTNIGSATQGTSETLPGLEPGTQYDVDVIASNSAGSATSATTTVTTIAGIVPGPPTALQITAITTSSATLSWAPSGFGSTPITYQARYRQTGQVAWINAGGAVSAGPVTITGLTSSTSYDMSVVATNTIGTTPSATITATTQSVGSAPGAPTNVQIVSITNNSASLTWSPSGSGSGSITYQPQYRISGTTTWTPSGSPTLGLSATITGLAAGTTYQFSVVAANAIGNATSAVSTAATTVLPSPPGVPGAPVAWIITATTVSLQWTPSTSGTAPITYQAAWRVNGTGAWIGTTTPSTATTTTISNLVPGTDYDFQVTAANSAGSALSPILTILAPKVGSSVSTASYQPGQVLNAEDLDASLNSKLDVTGGPVGPLQIAQSTSTGAQPAMLDLSRTSGGVSDAPLLTGTYTAIMTDGPVIAYGAVAMTVSLVGDATGNGPAGTAWTLSGTVNVNALRSTIAPATGSTHGAVFAKAQKSAPNTGVPSGRRMADMIGVAAVVADHTNLPSSRAGATGGFLMPYVANARDDVDLRYGVRIVYGEDTPVTSGGQPLEVGRLLSVVPSSPTAYAKVLLELGGLYNTAAVDLRASSSPPAFITSATPTAPVTTISVDRVLAFSSAGSPASAVNASNPKRVTINGNAYSVVAVGVTAGSAGGTLTFSASIPAADASQGNTVTPDAHSVWIGDGGDIALNASASARVYYDALARALTLASGPDPVVMPGTSGLRLPVGGTAQRPPGALGFVRANSDTGLPEYWQPSTSTWVAFTGTAITTGSGPGPALTVLASSPAAGTVSLSWSPPSTGAAPFSYQIQYRISGVAGWSNWGGTQSTTNATVSSLTPGSRYDFQIITSNGFGSSTSATASVTVGATVPSAVTSLASGAITSTTIGLSWAAPTSGSTPISYQVSYKLHSASTFTPFGGQISATSTTISALTAATSYDFQVVALNAAGSGAAASLTVSTAAAAGIAPTAPTSVSATSPTSSSLIVGWTAPGTGSTPFAYQVRYTVTGAGTFLNYGTPVTGTSVSVTGLAASTSYDFQVVAINSAGSATSATITGSTSATATPANGTVGGFVSSGSTVPVVNGPASGSVTPSGVLPITGITISDPAASTASGTCTLAISVTAGQVSSTLGGAPVAGSGTTRIAFTNSLSACQTVAANLVFTAQPTAGSVPISVSFVDQANITHSISVAVTVATVTGTGSTTTVPTDATGEVAALAQTLLNGIGVNTHIDDAVYQSLGLAQIENCINYLGGVTLLRDSTFTWQDGTWWPQVAASTGTRFLPYIGYSSASAFDTIEGNISDIPSQYLMGLEGCQEPDTGALLGYAETLAAGKAYQATVKATAATYGLPTFQMSFGQGFNTNPTQGNYGSQGVIGNADYGNIHVFPTGSPNAGGLLSQRITAAALATPNKPAAVTAFGWSMSPSSSVTGSCTPATGASYILSFIFDAFSLGIPYYFYQDLIDDLTYGDAKPASGLFDPTGAPRAAATAIRNLFSLLSDTGANALSFTPGKLSFSLTGMPSSDGNTGGKHKLFQKSDGTFWLVLWNEQTLNNANGTDITIAPASVTLTLGAQAVSVTVYDPRTSTTPVSTATSVLTVTISLPARPILVKIVHT
jgi:hypothetical protein